MRFSLLLLAAAAAFAAPRPADIPFKKIQLDYGANETAAFADLNGDGKLDIVNGENIFYSRSNTTEQKLRNQLGVYGSILTLNTITGSRQAIPECPYNIDNCNDDIAQIFDFVYTRRFVTGPASLCAPYDEADTRIVPYHPMSPDLAKWIGGKTGAFTTSTNELRYITDPEYRPYPMVIERDLRWNSSPSRLFQVNR
jgi:hypothetical protein